MNLDYAPIPNSYCLSLRLEKSHRMNPKEQYRNQSFMDNNPSNAL